MRRKYYILIEKILILNIGVNQINIYYKKNDIKYYYIIIRNNYNNGKINK